MSTKPNKIFAHPEREDIVKRLLNGESPRKIEQWLKKKHPRTRRLQVSYVTLQNFRREYLNIDGDVVEQIRQTKKDLDLSDKELEQKAIIASSNAYQEKLNEIVSEKLDTNRKLLEMSALISARMEYYFNSVDARSNLQNDKMFLELVRAQRDLVQDWKKFVEGVADKKIEHNINVNIINEQVTVLKSIVFQVLQELDPTLIPFFIDKMNSRMENLQYGSEEYKDYQRIGVIDAEYIDSD